jgi:uncharacterized protein YhaN
MKILALRMAAFGPFTDWSVDLSKGAEGMHLIYGPNEAGKSAALRGLKALLFGIDERTADNFIHDYASLRIAGTIQRSDGRRIDVVRRKGRSKTLLGPDESILDERVLQDFVVGVGADAFSRMFGLDHEELARGGQEIVSGKGDVGESLFAAALGGQSIQQVLEPLETEAGSLFKGGRPSSKLSKGWVEQYQQARKDAKELSLPGRDWEEHTRLLKEATDREAMLTDELRRIKAELWRLERTQKAVPFLGKRRELRQQRAEMGDVLLLPKDFSETRRLTVEALARAKEEQAKATNKITKLISRVEALVVPGGLLEHADAITRLHKALGSYTKALQDLQRLAIEANQLEIDTGAILKDILPGADAEDAAAIKMSLAKRQTVRELGTHREALALTQAKAKRSLESLQSKIERARVALAQAEAPRDQGELRDLLKRVQRMGDLEAGLSEARGRLAAQEKQADIELRRLPLWLGPLEHLEGLAVPEDETVTRFENGISEIEQELKGLASKLVEAKVRDGELGGKITALELTSAVPTEADLAEARLRRETGWKLVRVAWLEGHQGKPEVESFAGADSLDHAYEMSVHKADDVADRLRREADRVAQLAAWLAERERIGQEITKLAEDRDALSAAGERMQSDWRDVWRTSGIDPLPPREMRSWKEKQRSLVQRAENIRGARHEVQSAEICIGELRSEILTLFERMGEKVPERGSSLNAVIDYGQRVLHGIDSANAERQRLETIIADLATDLAEADRNLRDADADLLDWQTNWAAAVKELALDGTASPAVANRLLDRIQEFVDKSDKARGLLKRIEGIQRDGQEFTREVRELAARVAPDLLGAPPDLAVSELNTRLARGREGEAERKQLLEQLNEQKLQLAEAEETIYSEETRLQDMCSRANCREPEELVGIEDRSNQARGLDEELKVVSGQLLAHAGGGTVEELVRESETIDTDGLPGQIAELRGQVQALEGEISQVEQTIGKEKGEIARMDGSSRAAEATERAQSSLAQIRDGVERYIRLRLAVTILRAEVEQYRAKNQGPILKRASEMFAALTIESFAGLRTNFDETDKPVLVGVRPSGAEVGVEGMSGGTCDQLYLALRLASLENHLEAHEPMPFVIDDILVNFDNSRSEATLRVLAEISKKTQIIFFTHHEHLIALAESSVSSNVLVIHRMQV